MKSSIDSTFREIGISPEDAIPLLSEVNKQLMEFKCSPPPNHEYLEFLLHSIINNGDEDASGEFANIFFVVQKLHIYYKVVIGALSSISDEETKLIALLALTNIYCAASDGLQKMPPVSPIVRRHAHSEQTKPAHAKRSKTAKQARAIIEQHASAFWEKRPAFRGNQKRTAEKIREAVMAEILFEHDGMPPKGWKRAGVATEIDRIRKYIPKS
jgi:hypothetical protein